MTARVTWPGTRIWTPGEATAALPLVRRIADDLVRSYRSWRAAVDGFELAAAVPAADGATDDAARLMAEVQSHAAEVDSLRAELFALDIRVVRLEDGLLAFRSEREPGVVTPLFWAPGRAVPGYDWPGADVAYGTSTSWPSRAHDVAGKRSRA